jgi:DNA (cytosine-5)-methyltransferase 1
MIFTPHRLKDRDYRDQFIELVMVYVRHIESYAEKNNVPIPDVSSVSMPIVEVLSEMGVIADLNDLLTVQAILGSELYGRLLSCTLFYDANKNGFGSSLDKLSNWKRSSLQRLEAESGKPCFADFFAGAGGLSYGFTRAGFRVAFANDFEDVCVRTYKYNHPELPSNKVLQADIRSIVDNIDDFVTEPIDVVVGGPPCQGFSSANKQRIIDDPRNELYKYYIKAIIKILPKFVIMENVHGMLSVANQVVEDYEAISEEKDGKTYTYSVDYRLLNSADFSVAQARERLIFIAVRNDVAKEKGLTPSRLFEEIAASNLEKPHYLLRDALAFIPSLKAPRIKNQNELDSEECGKKIDYNHFSGDDSPYLRLINGGRKIPFTYNHKARYVNEINYDIYRLLEPGDDASDEKIADIMPYKHRLHCFKDKYFKLVPDKPSRTITAHLKMDCHSHIHPFQIRAITPREAARCQSFPDDYLFLGAYLKTYMQIGNAVPCIMAQGIAEVIKRYI